MSLLMVKHMKEISKMMYSADSEYIFEFILKLLHLEVKLITNYTSKVYHFAEGDVYEGQYVGDIMHGKLSRSLIKNNHQILIFTTNRKWKIYIR